MKVPFPANNPNPKPASAYEPKSVLDLRGSPSPVADQKPASILEDHVLITPQLDDWDSLMRDLGLHDDPNPVSKPFPQPDPTLPDFPPANSFDESAQFVASDFGLLPDIQPYTQNPNSLAEVGFDYVDELIRLAECFETNSIQLGQVILARLNQRLRSPSGKPLQRAAFYFKEALQSLLTGSTQNSEIIQTIKAHKTFSSISPIPMFSSFTANQAVLDAVDGSAHVHVVDFDIGLGGHWASFLRELSEKSENSRRPALRISALVPEDYAAQTRLISENLTQFARELSIGFEIDFVPIRTFEYLSFKSIKFLEGEKVAVVLSPAIFRQVGAGFLSDLRRVAPQVVVVQVDGEGQMGFGTASYRQAVIEGLEVYSTLLESLEAANLSNGGGEWMRKIEEFVVYPKIVEGVEAAGRRGAAWREAMVGAGMRQVGLSQFAEFQAECLLRRVQVRGFHVVKRQAEMLLCWHDRPLVATSAWRF
ncbi:scarecrow-like protein 15 [Salvia hispanica]|uniref:scarecrow-like protein 15 n=1 Tax=Salvia hispanica TaxID=49212 RepID=UPI002009C692|nr:scarecrow-like protein 15 [Salvia hispanica]